MDNSFARVQHRGCFHNTAVVFYYGTCYMHRSTPCKRVDENPSLKLISSTLKLSYVPGTGSQPFSSYSFPFSPGSESPLSVISLQILLCFVLHLFLLFCSVLSTSIFCSLFSFFSPLFSSQIYLIVVN